MRVLELDIVEKRDWHAPELPPARLFVDARSTPPRCSAVLVIDGACLYSDGKPHDDIMRWLYERADGQITSLEILANSMGLSTFSVELAGRKVVAYSDNTGAEVHILFARAHAHACTLYAHYVTGGSRERFVKNLGHLHFNSRDMVIGARPRVHLGLLHPVSILLCCARR